MCVVGCRLAGDTQIAGDGGMSFNCGFYVVLGSHPGTCCRLPVAQNSGGRSWRLHGLVVASSKV
jgi:hypothetical protein